MSSVTQNKRRVVGNSALFNAAIKGIRQDSKVKRNILKKESSRSDFVEKAKKQEAEEKIAIVDSGLSSYEESPESSDCGCHHDNLIALDKTVEHDVKTLRKDLFAYRDTVSFSEQDTERKSTVSSLRYDYSTADIMSFNEESFIDSHCHIDFLLNRANFKGSFTEYQKQNVETFPSSYGGCIAVYCNPHSFRKSWIWSKHLETENVWASFGCHPKSAADYNDAIEKDLVRALNHPKVRAVGEIGLDYSDRSKCPISKQKHVFLRQINIAKSKKLPLVVHCREAYDDCFAILKENLPSNYPIHLHCFTDKWIIAEKFLKEFCNLYIGITNLVNFPSAKDVHEVVRKIPLNRLLLETDAPYFVPNALSRKATLSHPGMAIFVAAKIASLKSVPLKTVVFNTRLNTDWIYGV